MEFSKEKVAKNGFFGFDILANKEGNTAEEWAKKPQWDVYPYGCERSALPAELQAQIMEFSREKVAKNGFCGFDILTNSEGKTAEEWAKKLRWDVYPYGCERSALPAELQAQIMEFSKEKVTKNGFCGFGIMANKEGNTAEEWAKKLWWDGYPYGCEPNALPAELQARVFLDSLYIIAHFWRL